MSNAISAVTCALYVDRRSTHSNQHTSMHRRCSHIFFNIYCNDDRTKKEKDRDIDVAKRKIHERDQITKVKRNQYSNDNNETNVEKEKNINNFNNLAFIESKDACKTRRKRRR